MRHNRGSIAGTSLVLALALAFSTGLNAGEKKAKLKPGEFNPDHASVEMFAAMAAGQLEVKFIPKDSTEARVFFKNKTDKPLNVSLPPAFAGVPVLAQLGGGGMGGLGGGGMGGMGGGGGGQGMGGGMGGGGMGGMGGMGGGGGGGFFNVAPEKVGEIRVACVCLEHGKKEPRPAMQYEIRPIESFTTDPAVAEMLIMFDRGKLNQKAAQAAAWHLCNKMSWDELAAKRIEHANGLKEPWFTQAELNLGMQIANGAQAAAREKPRASPGEQTASN